MKNSLIHTKAGLCRWSLAALVLAVQACGGGGSDGAVTGADSASASGAASVPEAPAPVAIEQTPPPAPAPTPAPAPMAVSPSSPAPAPAPETSPSSSALIQLSLATSCSIPGMREAILQQINTARTAGRVCGTEILPPVAAMRWNDVLFSAAARHSQDMATRNYFSHTSPEGVTFWQRISMEGYTGWGAGENIAAGQGSVAGVMAAWLNSEAHCRNIMQPVLSEVAVACVAQSGNTYGDYWTMNLGGR